MTSRAALMIAGIYLLAATIACAGGNGNAWGTKPVVTNLNPAATSAGAAVTLAVFGSNFNGKCVVLWNGKQRPSTVLNNGQINAGISSSDVSSAGTAQISVLNTSNGNQSNAMTFLVARPGPLSVATTSLPSGTAGATYSSSLGASGGVSPYSWSLTSGQLPSGLTLATSGSISGTPVSSGIYAFSVGVTDSSSPQQTSSASLSMAVSAPALSITTTSVPTGTVGTAYSSSLAASGGAAPYTWSLASGQLPPGLGLSTTGAISGTPTSSGTYSFTAKVTDSSSPQQTSSQQYSLSIASTVATLTITTASLPSGTVNTAYSAGLTASGGTTPYSWTVSAGSLPTGVSLSTSGALSGTPTAAGSYAFTALAKDSGSPQQSASKQYAISIANAASPTSPLTISTTSLPSGTVNTTYSASLAATGGASPYTWSLASGQLPAGVSLSSSGAISGAPTASGTFAFSVKASDSSSPAQTASQSLSLVISTATTPGTDWAVHVGGNVQNAINSAKCGDTITLDAGGTYNTTGFYLAPKAACSGTSADYITIRTSAYGSLPAGRISPSNASLLAKIVNTGGNYANFDNSNGGNSSPGSYWRLLGLEITNTAGVYVPVLVNFLGGAHFIVDHSYIHPGECPNNTVPYVTSGFLGVDTNATDTSITNNYFDCWWGYPVGSPNPPTATTPTPTEAIVAVGQSGLTIYNNYIASWYQGIFLGGGDPGPIASNTGTVQASPAPTPTSFTLDSVNNLQVGDQIAVQVPWSSSYCTRDNTHPCWGDGVVTSIVGTAVTVSVPLTGYNNVTAYAPTAAPLVGGTAQWRGTTISNVMVSQNYFNIPGVFAAWNLSYGNQQVPKGYFEFKICETCTVYGNIFDGYPSNLGMPSQDQNCGSPWQSMRNITVDSNWIKQTDRPFIFVGASFQCLVQQSYNITISNNVIGSTSQSAASNCNGSCPPMDSGGFRTGQAPGYTWTHNTSLMGRDPSGGADYYVRSAFTLSTDTTSGYYTNPPATIRDNIFGFGNYGLNCSNGNPVPGCLSSLTEDHNMPVLNVNPPNSTPSSDFPSSTDLIEPHWSSVLFTNPSADNYQLTSSSPGYHAASDGTDIGVNWSTFSAATNGVMTGNPTNPNP